MDHAGSGLWDGVTPMWIEENRTQLTAIDPDVRASRPMVNTVEAPVDFSLLRILVLEDRLVNQAVIQRQLKQLNATCTIANNGVEGLAQLQRSQFDIILADCSMPVWMDSRLPRRFATGNRRRVMAGRCRSSR